MTTADGSTQNMLPMTSYFLLGLLAGGAAALLLAPCSGREMRGKIRQGVNDGTAKVNEGVGYVKRRTGEFTGKAGDFIDVGKQRLAREGQRIGAAIEKGKEAFRRETAQA